MNNIENKNIKLIKNFFMIFLLSLILFFVIKKSDPQIDPNKFESTEFKIVFDESDLTSNHVKELKEKLNSNDNSQIETLLQKINIFNFQIEKKNKNILIEKIKVTNETPDKIKVKIKDKIKNILNGEELCFYFEKSQKKMDDKNQISQIQNFFTIKTGTNRNYFENKYKNNNNTNESKLKFGFIKGNILLNNLSPEQTKIYKENPKEEISNAEYNSLIKTKINKNNAINYFNLELKYNNNDIPSQNISQNIKIFINDKGDLPIQWPNKLEWNFFLGWGYIWNVLIIFISFFLNFFSNIFASPKEEGFIFGNLGLGIILTTILIRTLSWPIYTKASTFSRNMSLAQPEINKIQEKYALKKDKQSMQKMQMEIFKTYRKYNFSIFGIFISFLQMPILIAMFRTLNRFFVLGGIFKANHTKPFLGCIYLKPDGETDILIKIFLSFLVGISMFCFNKINLKRSSDLKRKNTNINPEQKKQEMTMKIVNYIMIIFMVFAAFKDLTLALYWITGNIYTIFQIKINNKIIKKHDLLNKKI